MLHAWVDEENLGMGVRNLDRIKPSRAMYHFSLLELFNFFFSFFLWDSFLELGTVLSGLI